MGINLTIRKEILDPMLNVAKPIRTRTPQSAIAKIYRDNLLNPDVSEIGIGYVFVADSDFGGYYTTDFAKR